MSDEEIIKEFLAESYDNLDRLDQDLIALEKDPDNRETLADVFRTIHTIKGTSGFLAFNKLEAVTHVGENLLARLRDGALCLTPEITTALLAMVDAVREMLEAVGTTGSEGGQDYSELIERLKAFQDGVETTAPTAEGAKPASEAALDPVIPVPGPVVGAPGPEEAAKKFGPLPGRLGSLLVEHRRISGEELALALAKQDEGDQHPLGEILLSRGSISAAELQEALKLLSEARNPTSENATVRVRVSRLDRLMNLMGELVLVRNRIQQWVGNESDSVLLSTSQPLNLITSELQEEVMKTRLQPIGNIWSKFPRAVRDVALGCGKHVRVEMEGKETELDRTIIEAIKDPLTHLVRNAVDHGIEPPEVRQAAEKKPEGLLFLRAFHQGGQVNIEISDDGAGLDHDKIRNKAVQKGLISPEQAARMNAGEISNLIFLPGFSTAEKVTNVSGRGVGMDVVKTNIERIGGTVDVESKPGRGLTVRLKIPLTLAIIPALIVTSGGNRYAVPEAGLLELVRLEGERARGGVEFIQDAPVYRLRGQLLPLVYLNRELKAGRDAQERRSGQSPDSAKPDPALARDKHRQWIRALQLVSGGRLVMTPDQAGSHSTCPFWQWLCSAGLEESAGALEVQALEEPHREFHALVRETLKLAEHGDVSRAAQELARVERVNQKIMEQLSRIENQALERQNVNIVVLRADDRRFGLVVDEINDTQEIVVKPLSKWLRRINAYAGATIMGDGKVALILDVLALAQRAHVIGRAREATARQQVWEAVPVQAGERRQALLLFEAGAHGRMAIPLSSVARLKRFEPSAIEHTGKQEVVQYRGHILPLVRVAEAVECGSGAAKTGSQAPLEVVVCTRQGPSVGLVVENILDVVHEDVVLEPSGQKPGVLGSALIQQKVTELVDVEAVVRAALPEFSEQGAGQSQAEVAARQASGI